MAQCTVIKLKTVDQRLTAVQQPVLASGDVGTVRVEYALDSYWDGYTASGTFYTGKKPEDVYEQQLTEGACVIPWEVLQEDGVLYIGLRGVDAAGLIKTAAPVRYRIEKGSPVGSATAKGPTPDVYQQMLETMKETEEIAQSVRDDANNGEFIGERGPAGPAGVYVGTEAPTNGETVWIDTDAESDAQIDVVAKVGQVLVVKAVDADGHPTELQAVDFPKAPAANWNANEGEEGHIEGRTHYVDKYGVVHKIDNKYIDADWMATKENGGAGKTVFIPGQTVKGGIWSDLRGALVEGVVYAVEVKGLLYECECLSYDGTLYLGNGSLFGDDTTEHNNEPFCIAWMGGTTTGGMFYNDGTLEAPIGIEVRDWQDTMRNKLPEEYLPDCAVKGDKNGVLSWFKLSDKPFVEGASELLFTHTATFTSDAAAKNGVLVAGAEVTAILDTIYWLEVNGELLKCHWERVSFNSVLYDEDGNAWVTNTLAGVYVSARTAGTYSYKLYAPSDELMLEPQYLPPNIAKKSDIPEGGGGANIDVVASVGQTIVVEEVDADGKPTKWKAADYQERTHWSEETVGDIVPHTAFTPYLNENFGCTVHPVTPFELEEGKSYTVIFDGVEYACTAMPFSIPANNMEGLFIGNPVFAGGGNNGMPFGVTCFDLHAIGNQLDGTTYLYWTEKWYMVLCMDTEQHTVQVVGEKREYHKIPEEYVSGDFLVHFSRNSIDDSWVMATPWEAIIEAVNAHRNIRGVFYEEDCSFDQYGYPHKEFVYKNLLCLDTNVGREGNTVCTLLFLGLLSNTGGITVKVHRDENGVTTVEEGW